MAQERKNICGAIEVTDENATVMANVAGDSAKQANTQQATELSDNNVIQMCEAAEKINGVKETIMQLKKYQDALHNEA